MTPNLLDELEKIVALSEKATPGKVELHTSCSWRRIVAERGRPFLVPTIDPDRHQNMDTTESAEFVVALVNWFRTHATALADMARDARRYRWLRDLRSYADEKMICPHSVEGVAIYQGTALDSQIDAAIDAASTKENELGT